ncbi:hypothetical protein KDW_41830 [Dictyobacter vulcani]|uniref:Uncharacterized protein n=1 Tax=Dictyobacter vulcani TaxID=2607529 RepID=A0A5J4KU65_9CHLR|nr:hypothetical protein [Dictyobacter vulcani]GER90021.1 hypothetical protein KDW_41830 [Dictyobacter vulcani]
MPFFLPKHIRARASASDEEHIQESVALLAIKRPHWLLAGLLMVVLISIIGGILFHPLLAVSYQNPLAMHKPVAKTVQASGLLQVPFIIWFFGCMVNY